MNEEAKGATYVTTGSLPTHQVVASDWNRPVVFLSPDPAALSESAPMKNKETERLEGRQTQKYRNKPEVQKKDLPNKLSTLRIKIPVPPGIWPSGDGPFPLSPRPALLGADCLSDDPSPNPAPGDGGLSPPGGAVHESVPAGRFGPEDSSHEFI